VDDEGSGVRNLDGTWRFGNAAGDDRVEPNACRVDRDGKPDYPPRPTVHIIPWSA